MEKNDALYDKHIKCPVCSLEFTSKRVKKNSLKVVGRDTDLMTQYDGENPLFYLVFVCPKCGYANSEAAFEQLSYNKKKIFQDELQPIWVEKDYTQERTVMDGIDSFKLLLYCEELTKSKLFEKAGTCLKLAWLYRIAKDTEKEKEMIQMSLEMYKTSYSSEDYTNTAINDITVAYLIAELSYRMGDIDTAVKWMSSLMVNKNLRDQPQIQQLAREQWEKIKAERAGESQ